MPEPKTIRTWTSLGYRFACRGECPACHKQVEFWAVPSGDRTIILDPATLEAHFSECPRAKAYRAEQKMQAGVL